MPSNYSFVTGKTQLIDPNNGSFVDTWDQPCNSNFGVIDASVSGTTVINIPAHTTPGTPYVTLTFPTFPTYSQPWTQPLAAQNLRLLLTGALSYNVSVYIPANVPGMWLVDNQTTNGFTITIKTNAAGSQGVAVPQGYTSFIFCDGTNVNWADQGNVVAHAIQPIPVGMIAPFAMTSVPSGWLSCDGSAVSRLTYAVLFSTIGTVWGAGDGSTTFNVPNFNQGAFLRGIGGNAAALGTQQTDTVGPHTHSITDPGHFHKPLNSSTNGNFLAIVADGPGQTFRTNCGVGSGPLYSSFQTEPATTGITVNTNTGSVETRPVNYSVAFCIKA